MAFPFNKLGNNFACDLQLLRVAVFQSDDIIMRESTVLHAMGFLHK